MTKPLFPWTCLVLASLLSVHCTSSTSLRPLPLPLSLACVTWNLAEKSPQDSDCGFIRDLRGNDCIAVGVQECESIKPRREEGRRSRLWRLRQKRSVGRNHDIIAHHRFGGMQLSVFVKTHLVDEVQDVQVIDVACGIGNLLSNKGAIAVLLRLRGKTICIINAHLAAHQNNVEARNYAYIRIRDRVLEQADPHWFQDDVFHKPDQHHEVGKRSGGKRPSLHQNGMWMRQEESKDEYDMFSCDVDHTIDEHDEEEWPFDAVLFMGDLNYRIDLPRYKMERMMQEHQMNEHAGRKSRPTGSSIYTGMVVPDTVTPLLRRVLKKDQLAREKRKGRAFTAFSEGPINFYPTYKYDKGSGLIDSSDKARIPGWPDRILYRSRDCQPRPDQGNSSHSVEPGSESQLTVDGDCPACRLDLNLGKYYSVDVRHGDHRPVVAVFDVNISGCKAVPE